MQSREVIPTLAFLVFLILANPQNAKNKKGMPRMVSDDLHGMLFLKGLKLVLLAHLCQCLHATLVWLGTGETPGRDL